MNPWPPKNVQEVLRAYANRRKRMTQTEISRASGATVQAICDVEKQRRPPSGKLLAWLGYELAYVKVKRAPADPPADSAPDSLAESSSTPSHPPADSGT